MNLLSPGFKPYPKAGVVRVMEEAARVGFTYSNPEWSNLGQGGPELGEIPGANPRFNYWSVQNQHHGYTPMMGMPELRDKIAQLYNQLFRKNFSFQFSKDNIFIAGGGRLTLSRIIGSLDKINLGLFNPDYSSYLGICRVFNNVNPIVFELSSENQFDYDLDELKQFVIANKIEALLLSNPCNPTGKVFKGDNLKNLIDLAQKMRFTLIIDEFYFNHIYDGGADQLVSAAQYIEDIENTPVIMVSGLSKVLRYPGWRLCWAIGPSSTIENIASVGSFLDGGASHPTQFQTINLISPESLLIETEAIYHRYKQKRDRLIMGLQEIGIKVPYVPQGAFYVWADLSDLPRNLTDGYDFFMNGLQEKVIVVPGEFFNMRQGLSRRDNPFKSHVRLSFSALPEEIEMGLEKLKKVVG